MADGDIGSLGTGPLSYTREEISALLAPLISLNPDPGEIGCFIILTAGQDGRLSGWRTDCKAPEHAIGLLAQGLTAVGHIIAIERRCGAHGLHERDITEHQQGDTGTLGEDELE